MNNYFLLSKEQQQMVLTQAANKTGLPVQAVEKDLWVTVVLHLVFALPVANHLVFKGGTSLSKVWKVIHRFSEDIDLAIDPSIWGFEGDLTKKQIKRLRKASSIFVRDVLCQSLQEAVAEIGLGKWLLVEADPDGEGDGTYPDGHSCGPDQRDGGTVPGFHPGVPVSGILAGRFHGNCGTSSGAGQPPGKAHARIMNP